MPAMEHFGPERPAGSQLRIGEGLLHEPLTVVETARDRARFDVAFEGCEQALLSVADLAFGEENDDAEPFDSVKGMRDGGAGVT